MKFPRTRNEQRLIHCQGEALRGSGRWPASATGMPLEPPFEPFRCSEITDWDLVVAGFKAPYQGRFLDRLKRLFIPRRAKRINRPALIRERKDPFHVVLLKPYQEDQVSLANAEQLLLSLGSAREPVAFELFGTGSSRGGNPSRTEIRFVIGQADLALLKGQLHSLYSRAAVESHQEGFHDSDHEFKDCLVGNGGEAPTLFTASLCLEAPCCFPIRTFPSLANDPLGGVIGVMEQLGSGQWALVQVLFSRAQHAWAENLRLAVVDSYQPKQFLIPGLDHRTLADKLRAPLYAVSIRLASNSQRQLTALCSWAHQYQSPRNRLAIRPPFLDRLNGESESFASRNALLARQALSPGMLLNAEELVGVVHLPSPSIASERLLRVKSQTRQPPRPALQAHVSGIGQNVHRGHVCRVGIPPEIRTRHCYIAGATGTGKSTLLTNMIVQDIAAGHGVGLLDPHGDLVKVVLRHIPQNRIDDVVLFDAADTEFPFALNILEARDETERERIVAETIMALERYFPASWGPRLERILQYTIRTVLHAIPGATLADVERLLTDAEFRQATLEKTTDPRLVTFWTDQFKFFPKNATDPVLNKLSVFLLDRCVRNIICQRRSAIDFDQLLNEGKILLANLSTGLLTEKVAGTLGSFLVTKIVNAAFRRAAQPAASRRPWHLYIDEFQNFVNLSVGFERILAEARKQSLTLTAANQHVGQLSQGVRQAIFGNVGSLVIFRLGIEDAHSVAKELGVFTPDDILNLEVGQAIARVGGSSTAFNLETYLEPSPPEHDPSPRIVALARSRYARPRPEVERELRDVGKAAKQRQFAAAEEPSDPNEDDLVV